MSKYTAIIIEPRPHKALEFVLTNFIQNLSNEWSIIIFHGNKNIEFVNNAVNTLGKKMNTRIINIVNLNVDNLNSQTYSDLFLTESFYNYIPTETFLVFQTDSMILKENKENINLFLEYDYVGAPWIWNNAVGNGGLSLRKKSKMLEILHSKGYLPNINEDIFFSHNIDAKINYNVPDYTKAKMFSVETLFYDSPFGVHNCWIHLNKANLDFLTIKYPDIKKLINLQFKKMSSAKQNAAPIKKKQLAKQRMRQKQLAKQRMRQKQLAKQRMLRNRLQIIRFNRRNKFRIFNLGKI